MVVEENIRAEPGGIVLGRVPSGAVHPVLSLDDQWVQIRLGGWIWAPSVQTTDRLGFDLRVSADPQENLREEPQGTIVARLVQGTLLNSVEDIPNWVRVQRDVWVWRESVEVETGPSDAGPGAGLDAGTDPPGPATDSPGPVQAPRWWRPGEETRAILSAPDGDTLALTRPGADFRILAREGNWVRVRLEGWAWAPQGQEMAPPPVENPEDVTPAQVASDPQRYTGGTFSWELQFVSLERAEKIRTDFYEGEPFLLTRVPETPGLFVYVPVPPDRVSELEGLIPLERIRVTGRLRTGAASLTGNPILDLVEITRVRRDEEWP